MFLVMVKHILAKSKHKWKVVIIHFVLLFFFLLPQQWWHQHTVFTIPPEEPTDMRNRANKNLPNNTCSLTHRALFSIWHSGNWSFYHEPADVFWFPNEWKSIFLYDTHDHTTNSSALRLLQGKGLTIITTLTLLLCKENPCFPARLSLGTYTISFTVPVAIFKKKWREKRIYQEKHQEQN